MVIEFLGHVFWRKMFNHDYGFSSFTGFDFLRFYRLRMWWYAIDRHIWDDMRCDGMRCCVVKGVMVCDLCCAVMRWCVQWCDLRSEGMRSVMRYGDVCGEVWWRLTSVRFDKKFCPERKYAKNPKKPLENPKNAKSCQNSDLRPWEGVSTGFWKNGIFSRSEALEHQNLANFPKFRQICQKMPKFGGSWENPKKWQNLAVFGRSRKFAKFYLEILGLLTPFPSQLGAKKGPVNIENPKKSGVIR